MVINLKRFKKSDPDPSEQPQSSFSFGGFMGMSMGFGDDDEGAGVKVDDVVDFPLDGLDLNKYVKGA